MPYLQHATWNGRVALCAAAIALAVAALLALTPLARTTVSESLAGLRDSSRGTAGRSWKRLGAPLVVVELAIAVVLLVGAGLLGKSFSQLLHVDVGFASEPLTLVTVLQPSRPDDAPHRPATDDADAAPRRLAREVTERLAALPVVDAVGYADLPPLSAGLAPSATLWIVGRPEGGQRREEGVVRRISAGYFRALGVTVRRGREFTDHDLDAVAPVLIINQTTARLYFPHCNPIGQFIALGGPSTPRREIVGIVPDIKDGPPESPALPAAYVPFDQPDFTLVVRSSRQARAILPTIAALIRQVRPGVLIVGGMSMTDRLDALPSVALRRASAWLVAGFAAIAFVSSIVGLYGVIAYSVGLRRREIGVRVALGAHRRLVYQLVMGEAVRVVAMGTVLGLFLAVAAATLMRPFLFGVQAWDAPTLTMVASTLAGVSLVACYLPTRRAMSVNPIDVLREE